MDILQDTGLETYVPPNPPSAPPSVVSPVGCLGSAVGVGDPPDTEDPEVPGPGRENFPLHSQHHGHTQKTVPGTKCPV